MSFTTRVSGSSPAVAPRSHPLQKKSLARENRAAVAASTLRSNPSTDVAPRSGELTLRELPCDVSREVLNSMVYWGGPKAATALRTAGRLLKNKSDQTCGTPAPTVLKSCVTCPAPRTTTRLADAMVSGRWATRMRVIFSWRMA
jgi:hypothetical protein